MLFFLLGCSTVTPGNVVLAVSATAASEDSRYSIIRGGRYWSSINVDYYDIPTTEQRTVWAHDPHEGNPIDESLTFAGVDGQAVNVDIGIGYIVAPMDEAVIGLAKKYGPDINAMVDTRVRDATRDALGRCAAIYTVEEIYGEQKGALMDCVFEKVKTEFEPAGLIITRLTLNSQIRLPPKVTEAMEARITASAKGEQTRREVETIKAEGEKKVAAATAQAEALKLEAESEAAADKLRASAITPETIRLKELEVQAKIADKWDGKLPLVGGEASPVIRLDLKAD